MTAPVGPLDGGRRHWRTGTILVVLVVAVAVVAVLTPRRGSGESLSTYSSGPTGGRIIHDLAERLGWKVQRRTEELAEPSPAGTINAVLAPTHVLAPAEVHLLLESVRAGGALLVAGRPQFLADSLGYLISGSGSVRPRKSECATHDLSMEMLTPALGGEVRWRRPPPSEPVVFASIENSRRRGETSPAFVGVELGRGRVAIAGSQLLLANDVIRQCPVGMDVAFVRALEFLGGEGAVRRNTVLFDEYHHGRGTHPGTFRAIVRYATATQSGHLLLHAAVAGIVLLVAASPRPIAPRAAERIVRRSPLEHADALAHAYETVGATRTAAARLLSGVRRRSGLSRSGLLLDDDAFLSTVASSWPSVAADADEVRRALQRPTRRKELPSLARALGRIESALSTPPQNSRTR